MKKIKLEITASIMALISLAACITSKEKSDSAIPQVIKKNFNQNYSTAKDISWEKEDGMYEAEFSLEGVFMEATYDSVGKKVQLEKVTQLENLPNEIKDSLNKYIHDTDIIEIEEIRNLEGIFYEIEILENERKRELMFSESGTLLIETNDSEDLEWKSLPKPVQTSFLKRFTLNKYHSATKIINSKDSVFYEIKMNKSPHLHIFKANGEYIGRDLPD